MIISNNIAYTNIKEYGQTVKIIIPDNQNYEYTKAFIQPLNQSKKNYNINYYLDSGLIDMNNYLYIGLPDIKIDDYPLDTIIESNSKSYLIIKTNRVYIKDELIYIRAILKEYVPDKN